MIETIKEVEKLDFLEKMRNRSLYLTEIGLYYRMKKNKYYKICSTEDYNKIMKHTNLPRYIVSLLMVALSNNEELTGYKHEMKNIDEIIDFLHNVNPLIFRKNTYDDLHYRYSDLYTLHDFENYNPYWSSDVEFHNENKVKYEGRITNDLYYILKELKDIKLVGLGKSDETQLYNFKNSIKYTDSWAKTQYNTTMYGYKKTIFRMYADDNDLNIYSNIVIDFKDMIITYDKKTNYTKGSYCIRLDKGYSLEEAKEHSAKKEINNIIENFYPDGKDFLRLVHHINTEKYSVLDLFMLIDKINNYPHKKVILNNMSRINEDIIPKTKFNKYFDLDKNSYKKMLEMQDLEISNFLRLKDTLRKYYNNLFTTKNINFLMQDDFTMVNDSLSSRANSVMRDSSVRHYIKSMSDFRTLYVYLTVDMVDRQRLTGWNISSYYLDYVSAFHFLVEEGYNTEESFIINPFSIKLSHDIYTDEKLTIQRRANDELLMGKYSDDIKPLLKKTFKLKENSEDEDDEIILIKGDTADKLKDEGKQLSHCVGTYTTNIINDRCLIFFARRKNNPEQSLYTIELRKTDMGYSLGQTQGRKVYSLPKYFNDELVKMIKKINKDNIKQEELELSA